MANSLFSLFDDALKTQRDLAAGDPQTIDTISSSENEQLLIDKKIARLQQAETKVNYSSFSNFVFFNSALDYFNITAMKVLNEYPYDGTVDYLQAYVDDLDGYQNYVLDNWPSTIGHLRFNPSFSSSYVTINDVGNDSGVMRSSILNPGTGSLSVDFWFVPPAALTGTTDVMFLLQKFSGSSDGYAAYMSGSSMYFRLMSSSVTTEVSVPTVAGQASYFAFVIDRTSGTLVSGFTGSVTSFPILVTSASSPILNNLNFGNVPFYIGSGSLTGKITRALSGSLDDAKVWSVPRSLSDMSSSFNARTYAQDGLIGLWRFNESGSVTSNNDENSLVLDQSGFKLNGRISNYFKAIRGSGSLVTFDSPDPILFFDAPEIQTMLSTQQLSGTIYDRSNDNIITRLLPEQFFILEDIKGTEVLKNFLYAIAREFDFLKSRIDQFTNVMKTSYGKFDQAPDALLQEVGKFFGWELTGQFLSSDLTQYILGKNVLQNLESNLELDKKLYEIKNEFWRRVLINLMHFYKSKGTREGIEGLLRTYGLNSNFVRLKEYGYRQNATINTHRISAEKSIYVLALGSGSKSTDIVSSSLITGLAPAAFEIRARFPTITSADIEPSYPTGSICGLSGSGTKTSFQLGYMLNSIGSQTGTVFFTGSEGLLLASNLPIFDGNWRNFSVNRSVISSSVTLNIIPEDSSPIYSASLSSPVVLSTGSFFFSVGALPGGRLLASGSMQGWVQEARVWSQPLSWTELSDHSENFQSYGTDDPSRLANLQLHWRLQESYVADANGNAGTFYDYSGNNRSGSANGFLPNTIVAKKFLFDYDYIASPDFSWNQDKIRVFNTVEVPLADAFIDNNAVALEFNMVDALNEDISQTISSMDEFNNFIGAPANRYRESYGDLRALRTIYFKRLQGRLNFTAFADMLEFFDRSFVDVVKRLMPVDAVFLGDEFVVESHMLERPKLQWNYHRQQASLDISGSIQIYARS